MLWTAFGDHKEWLSVRAEASESTPDTVQNRMHGRQFRAWLNTALNLGQLVYVILFQLLLGALRRLRMVGERADQGGQDAAQRLRVFP